MEYEARNMVADTVVFIVPLIEYANAFSHVRPVSRQRQTATATKSWKQARRRRRSWSRQKSFYLGGLVDICTDLRTYESCLMQTVWRRQGALRRGGVYSWPTADTVLQVITGSSHGTYKILILPNKSVKNMANCTSTTTRKGAVKNIFKRMFWERRKELNNE